MEAGASHWGQTENMHATRKIMCSTHHLIIYLFSTDTDFFFNLENGIVGNGLNTLLETSLPNNVKIDQYFYNL